VASRTTKAAGNWSTPGTWTGNTVPVPGDTAVVGHNVVLDVNADVGTSPAANSGTWAVDVTSAGTLSIAAGKTLTLRGDLRYQNNTGASRDFVLNAGAALEFNGLNAATPATARYKIQLGAAAGQHVRIKANGTSGARCQIRSAAGAGCGRIVGHSSQNVGLNLAYTDVIRMGDASTNIIAGWDPANNALNGIVATDTIFDTCGTLGITFTDTAVSVSFTRTKWKNTLGGEAITTLSGPAAVLFDDCIFDKIISFAPESGWIFRDVLFAAGWDNYGTTKCASFSRVFYEKRTGPPRYLPGDALDCYWWTDDANSGSHCVSSPGFALTLDGCVWDAEGNASDGDGFPAQGLAGSAVVFTFRRCITLLNRAGTDFVYSLVSFLGNANENADVEHCTLCVDRSSTIGLGGAFVGETSANHLNQIRSFRSNLCWCPSAPTLGGGKMISHDTSAYNAGIVSVQQATHNGRWNLAAQPYNVAESASLGANDVTLGADPFVDKTVNLAAWDAALGGPGTDDHALTELKKRHEAGYNAAYNHQALLDFIRAGMTPTDAALAGAAHDGTDIGAVAVQVSGPTETTVVVSEGMATGDTTTRVGAYVRVRSDAIATADTALRVRSMVRTIAEAMGITELVSRVRALVRTHVDPMATAEGTTRAGAWVRVRAESMATTDAIDRVGWWRRVQTDPMATAETAVRVGWWVRAVTTVQAITESAFRGVGNLLVRVVADTMATLETVHRAGAWVRVRNDYLATSDAPTRVGRWVRVHSDASTVAESTSRAGAWVRRVIDVVGISDSATRLRGVVRVVTEAIATHDDTLSIRSLRQVATRAFGALAMNLANSIGPVVAGLLGGFGFNAQFYVPARVRRADASTVDGWAKLAGVGELAVRLSDVTSEYVLKEYGAVDGVTAEGTVAIPSGILITTGMGLRMITGPRAGQSYLIARAKFNDIARMARLALILSPVRIEEAA
jgi:hypothetical protein